MRKIGDKIKETALPFEQPGDFYYRRALKFVKKDEFENAVFNIRRALEKDSMNIDYMLDLAGILTEIEHFDDSNELLFMVLRTSNRKISECYFGLGLNFFGLSDYKKASSSLNKYLALEPEGKYSEDAEVMLESMNYGLTSEANNNDSFITQWKNALNEGDSKNAIDLLSNVEDQSLHDNVLVRNNLAVAYMLENKIDKAEEICKKILEEDHFNIHALCNMSMIKSRQGEKNTAKTYVLSALDQPECDYGELLKISIALCDLDMHEEAVTVFYDLLDENPYDLHSRHFLAIALFNLGDYENSLSNFGFIAKFKPDNSVNNWYIKKIREKMAGKNNIEYFPYVHQVSSDSVYSRINRINEILKDSSIDNPWGSEEFRDLVLWAFDIKDDAIKTSMIALITKYAGSQAASILHSKLCSRHVNDEIKHRILMSLKKLDEKEPYLALMDDSIVEVNVNTFEVNASKNLEMQREIIEIVLANMPENYDIDYLKYIIDTWNKLVEKSELFDTINNCRLWAAALEYNYLLKSKKSFGAQEIAIRYSVDINQMFELNNEIEKLLKDV